MPESLAVRAAAETSSITRVREVLDGFALRDRDGETLTAVRHFPARAAQWADFPAGCMRICAPRTRPSTSSGFTATRRLR